MTYVLLINSTGWVNKQTWQVGSRCVVTNYVFTHSVKRTSSRKLDVAPDKRKQLIISGGGSVSFVLFCELDYYNFGSPGVDLGRSGK